jgi:predicted transcriptional regulator
MIGLQPDSAKPSKPPEKWLPRAEYLETAKRRAMDLIRAGELTEAFSQFCAELAIHPELRSEMATLGRIVDGMRARKTGKLCNREGLSQWIHSFT